MWDIKSFIEYNSFYFVMPVMLATLIVFLVFNLPRDFYMGVLFLPMVVSFILIVDLCKKPKNTLSLASFRVNHQHKIHKLIAVAFSIMVLLFCFIDLLVNGIKILQPDKYAELIHIGKYVRNISNMCWVFVPVGYYCSNKKTVKLIFYSSAIIFPILFIDRNRFLMSLFCLFWLYLINLKKGCGSFWKILIFVIFVIFVFISIGIYRSGSEAFLVPSSGFDLIENKFPLKNWFSNLSIGLQQLFIYIGSPLFNFATVESKDFINPVFLNQQLSPFSRSILYPDSPVLVARFNVGTEFFPFLMTGGKTWVLCAFIFMYGSFEFIKSIYSKWPNIFTLLMFLRISYVILLMGFAPQFFVLTNIAFFILCGVLWFISALLYELLPFKSKERG